MGLNAKAVKQQKQLSLINAFHTKSCHSYMAGKTWNRGEENASIDEMPLKIPL